MAKYILREHKDELITGFLNNVIWLPASAVLALVAFVIRQLYKVYIAESAMPVFTVALACIAAAIGVTCMTISIVQNRKAKLLKKEQSFQDELNLKYKIDYATVELTFKDRENIELIIDLKMNVLSDCETQLQKDILWSGSDYLETKLIGNSNNYCLIDNDRKRPPYSFTIVYDEAKLKGDRVEFKH